MTPLVAAPLPAENDYTIFTPMNAFPCFRVFVAFFAIEAGFERKLKG